MGARDVTSSFPVSVPDTARTFGYVCLRMFGTDRSTCTLPAATLGVKSRIVMSRCTNNASEKYSGGKKLCPSGGLGVPCPFPGGQNTFSSVIASASGAAGRPGTPSSALPQACWSCRRRVAQTSAVSAPRRSLRAPELRRAPFYLPRPQCLGGPALEGCIWPFPGRQPQGCAATTQGCAAGMLGWSWRSRASRSC